MSFWDALRRQFQGQHTLANIVVDVFWAAIAICVAVLAARYLKRAMRRMLIRAHMPLNIVALAGNGMTVLVAIFCASVILTIFGVPTTAVITSFSLATAGIVLAFQDVLKNFIAGIYLLVERPFTIGDRVKVRDAEGSVEEVDIRTTALKTDTGMIILVPNTIMFTEIVTNRSTSGIGHATLTLTNVTGAPDEVSAKARAVVEKMETLVALPAPQTKILALQDGTAEMQVEFWYRGLHNPSAEAITLLGAQFPGARITSGS
ncbi:MAG TPA: mechanosensitive ion channel domain-containing protein [Thermomicrobiales bacterium]